MDILFTSPSVIYNGSNLTFEVKGQENGTYYYRVRCFNDFQISYWSNTVDIEVDLRPNIPKNLKVESNPDGNGLNISWVANTVDTKEYDVYCKTNDDWEKCTG